jgi:hypothetical protein
MGKAIVVMRSLGCRCNRLSYQGITFIRRQPNSGKLPPRLRRKEIPVARPHVRRGVTHDPPLSTICPLMNLPLYSPSDPPAAESPDSPGRRWPSTPSNRQTTALGWFLALIYVGAGINRPRIQQVPFDRLPLRRSFPLKLGRQRRPAQRA